MDIQIGTNRLAKDDLVQKARTFCRDHGIDRDNLLKTFRESYELFNGDKALIYVNVLQGISKSFLQSSKHLELPQSTTDLLNNFYLALACIEEVANEHAQQKEIDDLLNA